MTLKPTIASYSGQSYRAITAFLGQEALDLVARVAEAPLPVAEVDAALLDGLVEMHVLARSGDLVRLDTAVFLEADIRALAPAVRDYSTGLAERVAEALPDVRGESPSLVNFLVGIIGIGQTLGRALRDEGLAVDWQDWSGRFAHSKVDFDELCDAYTATGADLQNKTIFKGARYTAVFIGPGGTSYLLPVGEGGTPERAAYVAALNAYLTDAYAMLMAGAVTDAALRRCAEQSGLFRETGGAPVLTDATMARLMPVVDRVSRVTHDYTMARLGEMRALLAVTGCGRQGVPVESMMLHYWRYVRKGIARQLYAGGVFTDAVPETGLTTVFYANDVEALSRLLG